MNKIILLISKKETKKELLFLAACFILFIILRSVYFLEHLNFSADQGEMSTRAMELFRTHQITLIGPHISFQYQGHLLFQGPFFYYLLGFFLFLGNFDPVTSSYLFMLFCALMIIPLYYGVKQLISKQAAVLMTIVYTCFFFYVEYTSFHWNPNYQFSLLPVLVLLLGLDRKYKKWWSFLLVSIWLGLLLQFHYQFILIILGMFVYYFVFRKVKNKNILLFFIGLLIGFFPIVLFEIRNHFYNTQTLILYLHHLKEVSNTNGGNGAPHYFLSLSFMVALAFLGVIDRWLPKGKKFIYLSVFLAVVLFAWTAFIQFQKPTSSFASNAPHFFYADDYKAYQIIKSSHLTNYNVADLSYYDTTSAVIKFLLKRDNININYEDYYHNKYLFVISRNNYNYMQDPAYEVHTFTPSKVLTSWKLNNYYTLYLRERIPQ